MKILKKDPKPVFDFVKNILICGVIATLAIARYDTPADEFYGDNLKSILHSFVGLFSFVLLLWNVLYFYNSMVKKKGTLFKGFILIVLMPPIFLMATLLWGSQFIDKLDLRSESKTVINDRSFSQKIDKIEMEHYKLKRQFESIKFRLNRIETKIDDIRKEKQYTVYDQKSK